MINLAPFNYRNVSRAFGGPIHHTREARISIHGSECAVVSAYLDPDLIQIPGSPAQLYSQADGTGTHRSRMVAQHMAVSEALERWAFYSSVMSENRSRFGFDEDPTTAGMAAFPDWGLRPRARTLAIHDAMERFLVMSWWDGRLPAMTQEIDHGIRSHLVTTPDRRDLWLAVLEREESASQSGETFHAFGFGCGKDPLIAQNKAKIELSRNAMVLDRFYNSRGGKVTAVDRLRFKNFIERRCVYFSTEEGYAEFEERLNRVPWKPYEAPEVVFDGEMMGPWSDYTKVWRYALKYPFDGYRNPHVNFFYW